MRSIRQHKVDVAVAEALSASGTYLLPISILKADASRLVVPRPADTELNTALQYHDAAGRIVTVLGETESKHKLNDEGRAWLSENQ
jgi:hypothetical protein